MNISLENAIMPILHEIFDMDLISGVVVTGSVLKNYVESHDIDILLVSDSNKSVCTHIIDGYAKRLHIIILPSCNLIKLLLHDILKGEFVYHSMIKDSQGHMDGATHASIEFETYILMDIWSMYERDGRGYDMGFTEGGNELKEFLYECTHGGDLSQPFDWDYFYDHIDYFMDLFMTYGAGLSAGDDLDPNYEYHWIEILRLMYPDVDF